MKKKKTKSKPKKRRHVIRMTVVEGLKAVQSDNTVSIYKNFTPAIGQQVRIIRSSVNYAEGKTGVVVCALGYGWAVKIKTRKVDPEKWGTLEPQETESTVYAEVVEPYTPPPDEPKR